MGYRYRRRKRSAAGEILGDTTHIANRLSWRGAVILGGVLFVVFYWLLPAGLNHVLESVQSNRFRPVVEMLYARRTHWLEWLGIALGLACLMLAIYKYMTNQRVTRDGERATSLLSRILARFLD
jgi:uncharacterized protein involved in cysteine biosynthesis